MDINPHLLLSAVQGLEMQLKSIEEQIRIIKAQLEAAGINAPPKRQYNLSAEARTTIAEAQKKRWAKYRKQQKQR